MRFKNNFNDNFNQSNLLSFTKSDILNELSSTINLRQIV